MDDPERAVAEIKEQLDQKIVLLEHSVGVVMCHPEFIASGIMGYIGDHLPFDLVGITSAAQVVNDEVGECILTIFVMTADDVWFRSGVTASLSDGLERPTEDLYRRLSENEPALPGLALVFPPYMVEQYAGDAYVKVWGELIPGTPLYGTLASDDTASFHECAAIYNGASAQDAMSCILCYGNISPRFLIGTLPENSTSLHGVVTKSKDNIVYEINHIRARDFFAGANLPDGIFIIPFLFDLLGRDDYDGIPVVRARAGFTEDGAAIFSGNIDEGSSFSLLQFSYADIESSSLHELDRLNRLPDVNGALLFPCIVRRMVLLSVNKAFASLSRIKETIDPAIPFMLGYSGGEICPTSIRDGVPTNRFHNYSFIALIV
jgi:hypothetical protein